MKSQYMIKKFEIIGLIFGLLLIIGGCRSKQETVIEKHISFIYSFDRNEMDRGNIPNLIISQLEEKGYKISYDEFFLNSMQLSPKEEIDTLSIFLGKQSSDHKTDMLIILNDQAAYSALKTYSEIFDYTPTILLNIHYPNYSLFDEYKTKPVYCVASEPDFAKNIAFIDQIYDHRANILTQFEVNFLGKRSFSYFEDQIKGTSLPVHFISSGLLTPSEEQVAMAYYSSFTERMKIKNHLAELQRSYPTTPKDTTNVRYMPLRYMDGLYLVSYFQNMRRNSIDFSFKENYLFLFNNMDAIENGLCYLWYIPLYSCFCEGFNQDKRISGGYFASEASLVQECCTTLLEQLSSPEGCIIENRKLVQAPKDYYIDYKSIEYDKQLDLSDIPLYANIINLPFYIKHKILLTILLIIVTILTISLLLYFIDISKRTKKEKQSISEAFDEMKISVVISQAANWRYENGYFSFNKTITSILDVQKLTLSVDQMREKIFSADRNVFDFMCSNFEKGVEKGDVKMRIETFDGILNWFSIKYSKISTTNEKCLYIGIFQNIQTVIDNENTLIRARHLVEKAELKESFLANMSHEIRTPLNAIVGFSNLLTEVNEEHSIEDINNFKSIIQTNSQTLLNLIDDILTLSRIESGNIKYNIEHIDIRKMVHEVYDTQKILIRPELAFYLEEGYEGNIYAETDKLRLIQVFTNFLNNANKFTQTGSITLGYQFDKSLSVVRIYVKDTGIGLTPEEQIVIFDRFYKNNEFVKGTGLGLSICKVITENLNGHIEVSSVKGEGSTFSVTLPASI